MANLHQIERHYAKAGKDIAERVLTALGTEEPVTPERLAPVDQFHGGGLSATRALMVLLQPQATHHLLDLGSGIGGPARWIASTFGCKVAGIDLTATFCAAAEALPQATGLEERVTIIHGSALETPISDNSFDRAYSQNVMMNIEDKLGFYREAFRVLKPGGMLALSTLAKGPNDEPYYPSPWAETAETSFLAGLEDTKRDVLIAGFEILQLNDKSAQTRTEAIAEVTALETKVPPTIGVPLVMGERFFELTLNSARARRVGRLSIIEALLRKPG